MATPSVGQLDYPTSEAKTFVIDGVIVGLLPNGTIDLGHNRRLGYMHMTARNLDVTTAPLLEDCMVVVGHEKKPPTAAGGSSSPLRMSMIVRVSWTVLTLLGSSGPRALPKDRAPS